MGMTRIQTGTETRSVVSPLKVDKDWKEKLFHPANNVRLEEPKKARENPDAPIIEDWVSDDEEEVESTPKVEKKIPTATKIESVNNVKPSRRTVRYAEMYRSQRPRGNQRSWNGQKSDQLGCNFVFNNKACFICGDFDHIQYYCPNAYKHMVPRAVLMKTGLKTVKNAKPLSTVRSKSVMAWVPKGNVNFKSFVRAHSQLNDKGFVDSGCSRHMSGNIAHLSDFKDFDGGFVTFGGGANGGRITGKGTIKTDKLDFEDLPDESQILLKIPRQNNMYSFDMKNIVPKDGLTCLVAKATSEESMLWHRRLGHVNFKNSKTCKRLILVLRGSSVYGFAGMRLTLKMTSPLCLLLMHKIQDHDVNSDDCSFWIRGLCSSQKVETTSYSELGFLGAIYERKTTPSDLHNAFFALFLISRRIPKRGVSKSLIDPAWGHRAIGTKWVYRNKKDERGIVVRNKARLVAQGHTQEEDDIIFGSTKKELCEEFEKLMKDKFQMSSMGSSSFTTETHSFWGCRCDVCLHSHDWKSHWLKMQRLMSLLHVLGLGTLRDSPLDVSCFYHQILVNFLAMTRRNKCGCTTQLTEAGICGMPASWLWTSSLIKTNC
ncbi:ribonuclease H-like domain-containing protein [Tanacetum coccineum]